MKRMIALTDSFTPEQKESSSANKFGYIWSKADQFLIHGPDKYRAGDFFGMPDSEWGQEELELVTEGCRQVLQGMGLTPEKPFKGLGIGGFYRLFELFHFEPAGRKSSFLPEGGVVDAITFRRLMDEGTVTYYNLVEY
jgi:hypothetical protein